MLARRPSRTGKVLGTRLITPGSGCIRCGGRASSIMSRIREPVLRTSGARVRRAMHGRTRVRDRDTLERQGHGSRSCRCRCCHNSDPKRIVLLSGKTPRRDFFIRNRSQFLVGCLYRSPGGTNFPPCKPRVAQMFRHEIARLCFRSAPCRSSGEVGPFRRQPDGDAVACMRYCRRHQQAPDAPRLLFARRLRGSKTIDIFPAMKQGCSRSGLPTWSEEGNRDDDPPAPKSATSGTAIGHARPGRRRQRYD